MPPVLQARGLEMTFPNGARALRGVDLELEAGELVAFMGQSGAGKSTLLGVVGGLLRRTGGEVVLEGRPMRDPWTPWASVHGDVPRLNVPAMYRRMGYADARKLPLNQYLTVAETLTDAAHGDGDSRDRVADILAASGLDREAHRRPHELSVGQPQPRSHEFVLAFERLQLVLLCRAMVNRPAVLLADEPAGPTMNCESVDTVVRLLRRACDEGTAVMVATHDLRVADVADRVVALRHGSVIGSSFEAAYG